MHAPPHAQSLFKFYIYGVIKLKIYMNVYINMYIHMHISTLQLFLYCTQL